MTYTLADRAAAEGHPMLEVRRVALNDGSHASLILENGRISKLVSPSGEVARLHWEGEKSSPRQPHSSEQRGQDAIAEKEVPLPVQEKKTFSSARQFWASQQKAPKGVPKHSASPAGRSPSGTSETSEVASPPPAERSTAVALTASLTENTTGSSSPAHDSAPGATEAGPEGHTGEPSMASWAAHFLAGTRDVQPVAPAPPSELDSSCLAGRSCADAHLGQAVGPPSEEIGSPTASTEVSISGHAGMPGQDPAPTVSAPPDGAAQHAGQPEEATAELARGQEAVEEAAVVPEEATAQSSDAAPPSAPHSPKALQQQQHAALDALMGAAPQIDMRRLRAEVAGLPQLVSPADRAAMAAGKRVRHRGLKGLQQQEHQHEAAKPKPDAPAAARAVTQRPAVSDGAVFPPRSRLFEPEAGAAPGTSGSQPTAAAAVAHRPLPRPPADVSVGSAGVSSGESIASPAPARPATCEAPAGAAASASADSVTSVARRRHSLAEIRRAIAAQPSTGMQNPNAGLQYPAPIVALPSITSQKDSLKKVGSSKPSMWRKITAAFQGRRVQPHTHTGSFSCSLGNHPGSPAASSSTSGSSPGARPSLARRLFGARGFGRSSGSTGSEVHAPAQTAKQMQSPAAVQSIAPTVFKPSAAIDVPGGVAGQAAAALARSAELEAATPTSIGTPSSSTRRSRRHQKAQTLNRTGMAGRWRMEPCEGAMAGMAAVEALLNLPLLQRLAAHRAVELEILETDDTLDIVQDIPLNNSGARIRRRSAYLKSGGVVEEQRSDSREGILRSQLTISPEGHCHIRSLQGDPYAAVFHKRIKMSSRGHRIKIEQKFQLLAPGVLPVKYHSIWHRVEGRAENSAAHSNIAAQSQDALL